MNYPGLRTTGENACGPGGEDPALERSTGSFLADEVEDRNRFRIRTGITLVFDIQDVGELAGLYREERGLDLALTVIPCRGWQAAMRKFDPNQVDLSPLTAGRAMIVECDPGI